ncbi:MAG: YceI family protein [Crocinitomicaceae bacterium]|jgi:polyisoprenoid-binding protein YceI
MKKVVLSVFAAFALFSFTVLELADWSMDGAHSRLGFTIQHMGITDIHGQFSNFDVKMSTPNADFESATIEMTAQANSINTGIEMRDNHLKTADFFDAEKFPTLTFKSTSVKKAKGNKYVITGDFTMHGVTKSVTLQAVNTGVVKNQAGNDVAGFRITGVVKRTDFGVGQSGKGLADEVNLIADLEVSKN